MVRRLAVLVALLAAAAGGARGGEARRVLQLQYTAVSCGGCAVASYAVERLKAEAGDSLAVIGVHYYDQYRTAEAESLAMLYGVAGTPTAWFDGEQVELYADTATYWNYRTALVKRSTHPPGAGIALSGWYDQAGRAGQAQCLVANPGGDTLRGILRLALVEQAVFRPWGGGDSVYDVLRDLLPSFAGSPVLLPPMGSTAASLPFALDTAWAEGRMALVAWVQDTGTIGGGGGLGVHQCAKVQLSELSGVAAGPGAAPVVPRPALAVSPNPCAGRTVISYSLPQAGRVRIRLYNINGQAVSTLQDGQLSAGRHRCDWHAAGGIPSGTYFIRAESEGHVATARVTLVR